MKVPRWPWWLLLAVAGRPLTAAQVTLTASAATVTVGEQLELRLIVRSLEAVDAMAVSLTAGDFEIIRRQSRPLIKTADWRTFERVYTIAFFKTGDFVVGPASIELTAAKSVVEKEQSNTIAIRVRSLLEPADRDIRPLKKPLAIRGSPWHLLAYTAAGLFLLTTVWLLLRRRRRKKPGAGTIVLLEPEIELELAVSELWQRRLLQNGEHKLFFIRLGEIIKRFLSRHYSFNADDLTSAEVIARLQDGERDAELLARFRDLFMQADLVKFAELVPEATAIDTLARDIAMMVDTYKRRRRLESEAHRVQTGR